MEEKEGKDPRPTRYHGVRKGYVRRSLIWPEAPLEDFYRYIYWSRSTRGAETEKMIRHFLATRHMPAEWLDEKGRIKPIPDEVKETKRGRKESPRFIEDPANALLDGEE